MNDGLCGRQGGECTGDNIDRRPGGGDRDSDKRAGDPQLSIHYPAEKQRYIIEKSAGEFFTHGNCYGDGNGTGFRAGAYRL